MTDKDKIELDRMKRYGKYLKRMNYIMSKKLGKLYSKNRRLDIR